jgi:hypothetical protein
VELDLEIRTAVAKAFSGCKQLEGWLLESETPVQEITQVGKGYEKNYYDYGHSDVGRYELRLAMDPQSEAYKKWYDEYTRFMAGGFTDTATVRKFSEFMYRMKNATHITVYADVNIVYGTPILRGGHRILSVAGTAFGWQASYVAGLTGGGDDNAVDCTMLYVGSFTAPSIKKDAAGLESASIQPYFPKGSPLLSVQCFCIRIEASKELADGIISRMDLQALSDLLRQGK